MGVWAAAIQGGLAVDSGITQGREERRQLLNNQAAAEDAAALALQRGAGEAALARKQARRLAAHQGLAFRGAGVDATTGTAADLQLETEALGELDAQTIENNAAIEAFGFKKHGMDFNRQAGLSSSRRNREMAGTIIGSASNIAGAWNRGRRGDEEE